MSAGVIAAHYVASAPASAVTYQGAGTLAANTTAGSTLNVPYPASPQAGDILLLGVMTNSSSASNLNASWTNVTFKNAAGSSPTVRVSWIITTGSESGSLAVTTPNVTSQGQMLLFRGVDNATPIDVAATVFGSASAVSAYDLPTQTTTLPNTALVYFGASNSATGGFTPPTVPSAFTELTDSISTTPKSTVGYLLWTGSGATGTVNLASTSAVRGAAVLVALRPA